MEKDEKQNDVMPTALALEHQLLLELRKERIIQLLTGVIVGAN